MKIRALIAILLLPLVTFGVIRCDKPAPQLHSVFEKRANGVPRSCFFPDAGDNSGVSRQNPYPGKVRIILGLSFFVAALISFTISSIQSNAHKDEALSFAGIEAAFFGTIFIIAGFILTVSGFSSRYRYRSGRNGRLYKE